MKQGIWGILSLFLRKTFMKYAKKTEPKQGAANIKEICSPAKQSFSPFCLELLSLPNKNNTSVNNKQSSSFKRRKANKTKQNGHLNKQQQLISIVCNSLYMFSLLSLWQTTQTTFNHYSTMDHELGHSEHSQQLKHMFFCRLFARISCRSKNIVPGIFFS